MEVSPGFITQHEDQLVILTGILTIDLGKRVGGEGRGQGGERGREEAAEQTVLQQHHVSGGSARLRPFS